MLENPNKKLLFYSDSDVFGGHEISVIDSIKYILENTQCEVVFLYCQNSKKIKDRLTTLQNIHTQRLKLYPINYHSQALESIVIFIYTKILRKKYKDIEKIFKSENPHIIIVVQGSIEKCCIGLFVAKDLKYFVISFIPITLRFQSIRMKLGKFRDHINRYLYQVPDKFITITESMKSSLVEQGINSEIIKVAYCGLDIRKLEQQNLMSLRAKYNIPDNHFVIASIGRISFDQKAQDFLLEVFNRYKEVFEDTTIIFVGDGKDQRKLSKLVKKYQLDNQVRLIPWNENISSIYFSVDMIALPSRFEGLPLVVLESMFYSKPIIASNRDGMMEIIPKSWLFETDQHESFIKVFCRMRSSDHSELLIQNKIKIEEYFNLDEFGKRFFNSIFS